MEPSSPGAEYMQKYQLLAKGGVDEDVKEGLRAHLHQQEVEKVALSQIWCSDIALQNPIGHLRDTFSPTQAMCGPCRSGPVASQTLCSPSWSTACIALVSSLPCHLSPMFRMTSYKT